MAWLTENWFWILTFIAFIAMHVFARRWAAPAGVQGLQA